VETLLLCDFRKYAFQRLPMFFKFSWAKSGQKNMGVLIMKRFEFYLEYHGVPVEHNYISPDVCITAKDVYEASHRLAYKASQRLSGWRQTENKYLFYVYFKEGTLDVVYYVEEEHSYSQ
jgi:hypothetical protein